MSKWEISTKIYRTKKLVRGVLIAIVGEGCSQPLGQESNQCVLGNLEDAVKIEGHMVMQTDVLFEKWRTGPWTLHLSSCILTTCRQAAFQWQTLLSFCHQGVMLPVTGFHKRKIHQIRFCVWLLLLIIRVVRDWKIFTSSFWLFAYAKMIKIYRLCI